MNILNKLNKHLKNTGYEIVTSNYVEGYLIHSLTHRERYENATKHKLLGLIEDYNLKKTKKLMDFMDTLE